MVVLDEADVMLDMGFREDIELILQAVPPERQTVFFSATMPRPDPGTHRDVIRVSPEQIRMEQKAVTVPTVEQAYYEVDRRFKVELLTRLIDVHDLKLGIIFCNTKRMVDDLVDHLNAQGYSADRLHGDMSQGMRDRVMNKFRKSGLEFLVATDVAARGIDVNDVEVVFNYDLPYDAEDYVHRIGRTGRAGRSGRAISFVSGRELFQVQQIERYTRTKIQRARVPTLVEVEEARVGVLLQRVRKTLQEGHFKQHDHVVELLLEEGFSSTDIVSAVLHLLQSGDTAPSRRRGGEGVIAPPPQPALERPPREPRDRRRERPQAGAEGRSGGDRFRPAFAGGRREEPAFRKPRPRPASPERPIARRPPERSEDRPPPAAPPLRPVKASRRTPTGQTRLFMNVGAEMGVTPKDVVETVMGETGLPAGVVGTIDVRERHLFADVAAEHAHGIAAKLNRAMIKGRKIKVKVA